MYAVVAVGGNQHRVEPGSTLLVDRLGAKEGAKVSLTPVMFRGDDVVVDADGLKKVKVEAVVKGHERGQKIRVFKFKPKRGYKRTTGHRQELTRLEVTSITVGGKAVAAKEQPRRSQGPASAKAGAKADAKVDTKPETGAAKGGAAKTGAATEKKPAAKKPAAKKPAAKASAAAEKKPAARKPAAKKPAAKKPAAKKEE